MILTEQEASTRRCQEGYAACSGVSPYASMQTASTTSFAQAGAYGTVSYTAPFNCIGSQCMAWRWLGDHRTIDGDQLGFCGKVRK